VARCGYTLQGLSYEELAARHSLPMGTVGVTLHRALHRLRREIATTPKLQNELSLYLRLFLMG
jgi:DNA-directed RNA polymerase specialized sigma24 family protein